MQGKHLADHDALVAEARQVEALGYDELFSYDHVGSVDPFVPLVVAAEATSHLRVGPLVLNNEFHHPALLARTAATVDRLCGGRLVLGDASRQFGAVKYLNHDSGEDMNRLLVCVLTGTQRAVVPAPNARP